MDNQMSVLTYDDYLRRIVPTAPTVPSEAVGFWRGELQRLEGELYQNRNNGQVMQMIEEAKRRFREARDANFQGYVAEKTQDWAGGVVPKKKKPFEGVAEMIQTAQGIKRED